MREIFLSVIIVISSLNLTGCGEGAPDMAQVGQAVTQIAGLVGQMQGAGGGGNNGGARQAEAPQGKPAATPAAVQMPATNIRPQQNVQVPPIVTVQNNPAPQVETKQNTREPQVDEEPEQTMNTKKETDEDQASESPNQTEQKDTDVDTEDVPSSKNDVMQNIFKDEPLLATILEDNSPST